MDDYALGQLLDKLQQEVCRRPPTASIAILGRTPAAFAIIARMASLGLAPQLLGVYTKEGAANRDRPASEPRPLAALRDHAPAIVIVASDEGKEQLILDAIPYLSSESKLLIGGFKHFTFRDPIFDEETTNGFAPSFANGYPNTLIHIYQCLQNAARLNLNGVVAEFGMFKGGTTMLISRFIERLGRDWKVYGFDSFDGFPPPKSPLDMYSHPDCVYRDLATVQRFFQGRNVEIIVGDVTATANLLRSKDVVLAFIDTDNYTPAATCIDVIADQVAIGGAIVFDHFTGRDRFLYTLGERLAAQRLLHDSRYFNLHDTGVFLRVK